MNLALLLAIGSAPAVALACPVCARDGTPHLALVLGAMIAVPYAVAALAVYAIRGGKR
jgi:hypothetical protein